MRSTYTAGLVVLALAGTAEAQSTPPASAPQFIEINPDALLGSRLIGLQIQNPRGEDLGTVEDLALEGGQLVGVVLSVAGPTGAERRYVGVDPSSVSIRFTDSEKTWKATLNATIDQLRAAPEFRYEGKWKR
jgi:hypothetical protein